MVLCGVVAATSVLVAVVTYSPLGLLAVPATLLLVIDLGVPTEKRSVADIKVRRSLQQKVLVDEPVLVELSVGNEGGGIERATVEDMVPPGAQVSRGSSSLACELPSGAQATLRYEVRLEQPTEVRFEGTVVRLQSVFGLLERRLVMPSQAVVRAYPSLLSRRISAGRARALSWNGSSPSKYRGGRVDFMDIREYVAGDPLKDVNWKASARLARRLVNTWSVERGLDCIIVVDMLSDIVPMVSTWSARGEIISCTYELASSLIGAGNRVGMLIMGTTPAKIRPGFGSRHLRVMLDQLVVAQPGSAWKMEKVDEFLESFFRAQYRNRGGALLFVAPGVDVSLVRVQRDLSAKGFGCGTVIVNTLEDEAASISSGNVASGEKSQRALRLARAELDWFESELSSYSRVTEWTRRGGFVELKEAAARAP